MSEQFSKSRDNQVQQNGLIMSIDEIIDYLNTSSNAIGSLQYENAKLRTEVNEQQATIDSLKEENEQLKKELNSFEPVMFQDVRKGTVTLYSKEVTE